MYDSNHRARHFGLLFADVFQELCLNRYIVIPETGSSGQLKLFVTDRGWSWVDSGEPFPEYAEGYLATIRSSVPAPDSVIEQYLKEALATYDQRSFFSSSVMLGAASERLAYLLLDAIKGWVAVAEPDSVRRLDNVLHRDRSFVKLLEEIDRYLRKAKNFKPSPPDEAAEICSTGFPAVCRGYPAPSR